MAFKLSNSSPFSVPSIVETVDSNSDTENESEVSTNTAANHEDVSIRISCSSGDQENVYESSDSSQWDSTDDYDTDLEEEETVKDDDRLGLRAYQRTCRQLKTFPQKVIVDSLTRSSVHLTNRSLGPVNIRPLAAALIKNIRVEKINLHANDLGAEGATYIAELLAHNADLSRVDLSHCNIGDLGGMAIGDVMHLNKGLLTLNLSENKLGNRTGASFASALRVNHTLIELNLSHNNLSDAGAALLGQALSVNEGIQRLNLSWNKIRRDSAVALSKGLKLNDTITELDISWNGFGYEGALGLAEMLKVNRTLRTLDASNNRITWHGALLISQGLGVNDTLEELTLGGNPLTTTGCMDLIEAAGQKGCGLTKLDLKGVPVLAEFHMMTMAIKQTRDFECVNGGIVNSHDILGQRFGRRIEPMQRVIDYMKERELRPSELFRSFDKSVANHLPKEELINRLKKSGIPLTRSEILELLEQIESKSEGGGALDYKAVKHSVQDQVERERRRQVLQREREIRVQRYHKRILNPKLPPLLERKITDMENLDFSQIEADPEYLLNRSMSRSTLPGIGLSGSHDKAQVTRSASQMSLINSPCISMSRPLGSKVRAFGTGAPKKKKTKKKNKAKKKK